MITAKGLATLPLPNVFCRKDDKQLSPLLFKIVEPECRPGPQIKTPSLVLMDVIVSVVEGKHSFSSFSKPLKLSVSDG